MRYFLQFFKYLIFIYIYYIKKYILLIIFYIIALILFNLILLIKIKPYYFTDSKKFIFHTVKNIFVIDIEPI